MHRIYFLVSVLCFAALGHAPALKPADGAGAVFRLFAADAAGGGGTPRITIAGKQPLLVVNSVANIQQSTDRKAIRLTLNRADARRFADITRKHSQDLLILEAN